MIRIAVIDDEKEEQERLLGYYQRLREEVHEDLDIHTYLSGDAFLSAQDASFDLICLDIDMDGLDGISTAKEIRKNDEQVIIIFVTNMAQFAIRGYMVDALDFIVKPVVYEDFIVKLRKAVARASGFGQHEVTVNLLGEGVKRINISSIRYVEVIGHTLSYHTDGGTYQVYGTLKNCEELLGSGFVRCNNCYLVNLRYVYSVKGYTVYVDGEELKISQPRKKAFMKALNNFLGSGG